MLLGEKSLKFIVFADLHYNREKYTEETPRKLCHLAGPVLDQLIADVKNESLDFVACLGDIVQDEKVRKNNLSNLQTMLEKIKGFGVPAYYAIGNHDITAIGEKKLKEVFGKKSLSYSVDIDGVHLIFLGLRLESADWDGYSDGYLPKEDFKWLKADIAKTNAPCIIFSHYSLFDDDMTGNYWFEGHKNEALLDNREDFIEILKGKNVLAYFAGHQHWTRYINAGNCTAYVVGSMTENMHFDNKPDGVYFLVETDGKKINVIEKRVNLEKNICNE